MGYLSDEKGRVSQDMSGMGEWLGQLFKNYTNYDPTGIKPTGWQESIDAVKRAKETGTQLPPRSTGEAAPSRLSPTTTRVNSAGVKQEGRSLGPSGLSLEDAQEYLQRTTSGYVQGLGSDWAGSTSPASAAVTQGGDLANAEDTGRSQREIDAINAGGLETVFENGKMSTPVAVDQPTLNGFGNAANSPTASWRDTELTDEDSQWYDPQGPDMARRRAFLDAPDNMSGLKAVEASKGVVHAGGKYHIFGEDGDKAEAILSPYDYRKSKAEIQRDPQAFLASRVADVKGAQLEAEAEPGEMKGMPGWSLEPPAPVDETSQMAIDTAYKKTRSERPGGYFGGSGGEDIDWPLF